MIRRAILPVLLGLALAAPAAAQTAKAPAAPTPEQRRQLDAARAELDQAAKRFAELQRRYGNDGTDRAWLEQHALRRPVVGVLLAPDAAGGVRIAGVTPDGAAAAAGLRSGDRLVAVDGHAILGSSPELRLDNARALLAGVDAKTPVELGYVRDGRKATVSVKPRIGERMVFLPEAGGARDIRVIRMDADGGVLTDDIRGMEPAIAPDVRRELIRIGPAGDCKGGACDFPALAEALRWNGLNLASLEGGLGRYFGTDSGVLVLSSSEDLKGLEPGDVILRIDGKTVATPRAAMDALRGRRSGSEVSVDYLRDRKPATIRLRVPEPRVLRLPPPPPPPPAPPAAPAPPPPPAARARDAGAPVEVEQRMRVRVDADGTRHVLVDDGLPPPPAPPAAPAPPAPPPPPVD